MVELCRYTLLEVKYRVILSFICLAKIAHSLGIMLSVDWEFKTLFLDTLCITTVILSVLKLEVESSCVEII